MRNATTLSVTTSLESDKKLADLLLGVIGEQQKETAALRGRTVRLERTVIALIGRRRGERRGGK